MIKKNYPLPLISDIIENIGTKKLFIKLDLWWGYNNIWIKKEDKWKMVFITSEGSFEPTVIVSLSKLHLTLSVQDYDTECKKASQKKL